MKIMEIRGWKRLAVDREEWKKILRMSIVAKSSEAEKIIKRLVVLFVEGNDLQSI